MSVRFERLNGKEDNKEMGNRMRKTSVSCYESCRMGRIEQQC